MALVMLLRRRRGLGVVGLLGWSGHVGCAAPGVAWSHLALRRCIEVANAACDAADFAARGATERAVERAADIAVG